MSKVLWMSDAGCTTGFARVTHSIGERLVEDYGHEVHVLAVNFRGDAWPCERPGHHHTTPLRLYRPDTIVGGDIYGMARVIEMLAKVDPDVVVMLSDPQIVLNFLFNNPKYDAERYLLQYRPIIWYAPDDGDNLPPMWTTILPQVTNVVAMSKWGQGHYEGAKLVYHGHDPERFWPIWEKPKTTSTGIVCHSRADAKRAFGLDPERFLVGRVDTNSGRKDYPALVKALWPAMERHPDIDAWFHCQSEGPGVGVRLPAMLSRSKTVDPKRFFFPSIHTSFEGWPLEDLNVLYSAFDIVVSTSRGEGFGLGLLEAAACGIPIIAQNVSAIPEVVGPGGILIDPKDTFTVPSGEDQWLADIPAFTFAIERLYGSRSLRKMTGEAGAAHAKTFTWDYAARKFDEYITALATQPPVTTEAPEET